MENSKFSIFGYNSEKSIKNYNRFLMIPYLLITFLLLLIMRPIFIDVIKRKSLLFNSPWLFMIFYSMVIGICNFKVTVVHELVHVFLKFLWGKNFIVLVQSADKTYALSALL